MPTYCFKVEGQQIGFDNKLKLSGLADILQIAAWRHADELGFGLEDMIVNKQRTWAMYRLKIEVNFYPNYGSELKVITWPKKKDHYFAYRDLLVEYDGKTVARATSTYLLIDVESRKPQSLEGLYDELLDHQDLHAIEAPASKIGRVGDALKTQVKTCITDLDINRHVNNIRYLDWALRVLPGSFWKEQRVKSVLVNYFAELYEDQMLLLTGELERNHLRICGSLEDKEAFKVELEIEAPGR